MFPYQTLLKRNKARAILNVALQQQLAKVKVSAGESCEAKHDEERQTLSAQQKRKLIKNLVKKRSQFFQRRLVYTNRTGIVRTTFGK